jgi:hypothetical protein
MLDPCLLRLDDQYIDDYNMTYITPNMLNSTLPAYIREKFSLQTMCVQYGDSANLTCSDVRELYTQMVDHFIGIFKQRIGIANVNGYPDNDPIVCMLAECLSIIRAGIKKYTRIRTIPNQLLCLTSELEKRNHGRYGCSNPLPEHELCPTFQRLRQEKSCKHIFKIVRRT